MRDKKEQKLRRKKLLRIKQQVSIISKKKRSGQVFFNLFFLKRLKWQKMQKMLIKALTYEE